MNDFTIHRGETKTMCLVVFQGNPAEKVEYELKENEYYLFEMKKGHCNSKTMISKRFEDNKIHFTNEDTKDLGVGNYPFKVKLFFANGEFSVILDRAFIEVIE